MTGASAHVERVAHDGRRDVGEVHQHAEPVHLPHHFAAELGEAAVPGAVERGVGPVEGDVVGQGHVPGAELVVGPERAERVLDGVAALHAEQRRDPAALEAALDVVGGERQRQPVGIARDHPPGDVELLQLHPGVAAVLHLAGDVDRPELGRRPVPAASRARSVCLGVGCAEVVGRHVARVALGAPDLPRQVVVAVDQRRGPEQRAGVGERGIGGLRGGGCGHRQRSEEEREETTSADGAHVSPCSE